MMESIVSLQECNHLLNLYDKKFQMLLSIFLILSFDLKGEIPKNFVYLDDVVTDIVIDLKYFSNDNFIGTTIAGYKKNRLIITREAANALYHVQNDLKHFGYGLKIFDAYRPQKAVDNFLRWSRNNNKKMKYKHYPKVKKEHLFRDGYIASRSGHSRGSTVDLTIIELNNGKELDMGTIYDFFGKESWIEYSNLTYQQRSNRILLQSIMKKYGFKPLKEEWWHFTLHNEPYPDKYFNFNVE